MTLVMAVTAHGLGHWTRAASLLNALKPGYAIASECVMHRVPLVAVERPNFRETPLLLEQLAGFGPSGKLSLSDFFAGRWQPALDELLSRAPVWRDVALDGAARLARSMKSSTSTVEQSRPHTANQSTVERHTVMTELTNAPKFRGVVYDVGLNFSGEGFSVEPFDPALVEHDMRTIREALHCTAVRIEGEEIARLVAASRLAHALGLTVFFNPWKMNADADELLPYFAEAADEAQKLANEGVDVIFVAGCEYPIFNRGIVPGDTLAERLGGLGAVFGAGPEEHAKMWANLNATLRRFVEVIRPKFSGPVTYAATAFEQVDWSMFDLVGVDHYRSSETAEKYVGDLDRYRLHKPLVVMEVGCCAYVGAAALGGGGFMLLDGTEPDGSGRFRGGVVPTRSESEQAGYVEEQVTLLCNAGVDGVFVYVFSFPLYALGEGAHDLDMMSFSLVKTFPKTDPRAKGMPPWAPKESFTRLASLYRNLKTLPRHAP